MARGAVRLRRTRVRLLGEPGSADRVLPLALARFKAPKQIVFGELPKTSPGKTPKFVLRDSVKSSSAVE
jgi:acyl-CoA synthetase (AMP-forming)/AMP-acid ligase II